MALVCNDVSHWLGANLESAVCIHVSWHCLMGEIFSHFQTLYFIRLNIFACRNPSKMSEMYILLDMLETVLEMDHRLSFAVSKYWYINIELHQCHISAWCYSQSCRNTVVMSFNIYALMSVVYIDNSQCSNLLPGEIGGVLHRPVAGF